MASFTADPKGITEFIEWITIKRCRDKTSLCKVLEAVNKCIELWYKDINENFRNTDIKETDDYYTKIKHLIWIKPLEPLAEKCTALLREVRIDFEDQNLQSNVQKELDVEKLRETIWNIGNFLGETSTTDNYFFERILRNERIPLEELRSTVDDILRRLNEYRKNVNLSTAQIQNKLHCPDIIK